MKRVCLVLAVIIIMFAIAISSYSEKKSEYLRIHIRANSNIQIDQNVKYKVKDAIVEALIPYIYKCETKDDCQKVIENNYGLIENTANSILKNNGFSYLAKAKICNEKFPTRNYDNLTLEEGFYDALIIELGEAKGDNWWCVVYPPLCFVGGASDNLVYRSRIIEMIKSITK